MKEINDDTNNDNDGTNTNDPFTCFMTHGFKNYEGLISENQINLKIKDPCDLRALIGSFFLKFGSFI
jgi:hypothetical protein